MTTPTSISPSSYDAALAAHMAGRVQEAERLYEAFLKIEPGHSEAWHGLGVLRLKSGRLLGAIEALEKAVAAGGSAVVQNNLGVALCAAERFQDAAEVYRTILAGDPKAASALANLGQILIRLGAFAEARDILPRALAVTPGHARLHQQYGIALAEGGALAEAEVQFEEAIALDPRQAEYRCDLAALLLRCDAGEKAIACYRSALALAPRSPQILCGLGEAFGHIARHEDAVACFKQALAFAPDLAIAHYNIGTALTYLGRMAEAEAAFKRAAELEPANPAYRGALIALHETPAAEGSLQALEAMAADGGRLAPRDWMELQFTLAKAYDDADDPDRAFDALQRGNAAKRRLDPYDLQEDLTRFAAIAETFTADLIAEHAADGNPSDVPVFILGMPRSGTTLVEQILASHPDVFGAGELSYLADTIRAGRLGSGFPASAATLTGPQWHSIGAEYVQRLRLLSPQAKRITDKLPLNFQLIGLIRLALPNARIIHVRRDPMDTCFSCYFTLFANGLGFRDDLGDLGRYYRGYQSLMAHWRSILPEGAMLEVQYEVLVQNFETEARRLLAYCGLAWDERCAKFHETVRPVETASTLQVRRPLYQSSLGRAKAYAPWLAPLERALSGEV